MATKSRMILTGAFALAAVGGSLNEPGSTSTRAAMQEDVPFRLYITELVQLDADVDPVGKLGDYYARVTINGVAHDNNPACGDDPNPLAGILVPFALFSNFRHVPDCTEATPWTFTQQVPGGAPVTVRIQVFDRDFLTGDDEGDATPGPGNAIELVVDPATGRWSGDVEWPEGCSRRAPFDLGSNNVRLCWQVSFDSDGDGLLDVWERSGVDTDNDGVVDFNLPAFGADPLHKDLFVEMDWMAGSEPQRTDIVEWKQAFAAAPVDSGGTPNPDGLPGITLWVDTGALTDSVGNFVGDNLGGGNEVAFANVSSLTRAFYQIKAANFAADRALVFRYGLSSAHPLNNTGTSTGDNSEKTLNDTTQNWIPNEWKTGGRTVEIVGGAGAGQKRTVVSNTATRLSVDKDWDPVPDATSTYAISLSGGFGERGGNDFVDYNHDSSTKMHEFGHTLDLGHGGGRGISAEQSKHNCKPNYVSVMSYDHDRIFRTGGSDIIDYSPPRQVSGTRSTGALSDLDEKALNEATILDADDPDNMFVFVAKGTCDGGSDAGDACVVDSDCEKQKCAGAKMLSLLSASVDWNGDGDEVDDGLQVNTDTSGSGGSPPDCKNNDLDVLEGHDDWRNIALPLIGFGDAEDAPLNLADGPEPTREERLRLNRELNTADIGIAQSAPPTVEVGDFFNVRLTVVNRGPNPALITQAIDMPPSGVTVLDAGGCQQDATGRLACDLSTMLRRAERQINLRFGTGAAACVNGLPQPLTNSAAAANVARFAGPDPQPSDNSSSITVQAVDTTAPVLKDLTTDVTELWPPNHALVPVTVAAVAADLCDPSPACRVIRVASSEPVNGRGDGNTSPDWEIVSDRVVRLRAERAGGGTGRVYTIVAECRDASGNTAAGSVNVVVPLSRGR